MIIPDVLRSSVLTRIRLMGRLEGAIVMRASVIGRTFEISLLAAAMRYEQSRVRAAVEAGCELQLLMADGPGDGRYSFRHALTRDILYAELLAARVRPLHRRIASALESTGRECRDLDELAYHWWAAGNPKRALYYNELAGDGAAAVHALDDARRYYTRARSLIVLDTRDYARLTAKLRAL